MSSTPSFSAPSQLEIQRRVVRKSFLMSFSVFLIFVGITLFAWRASERELRAKQENEFKNLTREMSYAIETKVYNYLDLLQGVQRFFTASQSVDRQEWSVFLSSEYLAHYPGVTAVRYVERVPGNDQDAFIQSVKRDKSVSPEGYPDFSIRFPKGIMHYIPTNEEYYVVKYVQPYLGNESMLGLEVLSDPAHRRIYDNAWATGKTFMGPITELETKKRALLGCIPLYNKNLPSATVLERQKALMGFVDIVIMEEAFFPSLFKVSDLFSKLQYEVYNGELKVPGDSFQKDLLFSNSGQRHEHLSSDFQSRYILKVANSTWTVFFFASQKAELGTAGTRTPFIVLIAGFSLSFLIWGILYVLSSSRLRAVLLAQEMTVDLQASEQRLRAISQSAIDAVISADSEERIIFWNDGAQKTFGYQESEIFGKPLTTLFPLRLYSGEGKSLKKYLEEGPSKKVGKIIEVSGLRKGGGEFPAEMSIATWKKDEEDFFTMVIRDVSEQKKIREELVTSRDRYAKLIEEAPDPMLTVDVFQNIRSVNVAAERLINLSAAELLGKNLGELQFITRDSLRKSKEEFTAIVSGETRRPYEIQIFQQDSELRTFEVNLQALRREGEIEAILAIFRDLTERKKVERIQKIERAVIEIFASAQTVAQGASGIVEFICKEFGWEVGSFWVVDEETSLLRCIVAFDGKFVEYGKVTREMTVTKGEGVSGHVWATGTSYWIEDVVSVIEPQRKETAMQLQFKKGVAFPIVDAKKVLGVLEFFGTKILKLDVQFSRLFEIISHQSGQFIWQKKAEEELKEAERALGERERFTMVSQLAAGVAHEVKNPLAFILQGADYLKNDASFKSEASLKILDNIIGSVARADNIIRGLLELSRPERLTLRLEDIHSVIETSLLLSKNSLDNHNIRVCKEWQSNIPNIEMDRGKIEQVFINLFANAVEAMGYGGTLILRTQWISQEKGEEGMGPAEDFKSKVVVEIEDTGPGISAQELPKVFMPFVTSKRARGGSGLGLPIVKNIMEMHNGMIKLENRKAGGAKATVVFRCDVLKTGGGGGLL